MDRVILLSTRHGRGGPRLPADCTHGARAVLARARRATRRRFAEVHVLTTAAGQRLRAQEQAAALRHHPQSAQGAHPAHSHTQAFRCACCTDRARARGRFGHDDAANATHKPSEGSRKAVKSSKTRTRSSSTKFLRSRVSVCARSPAPNEHA